MPTGDELVARVRAWAPGVVGFSVMTQQYAWSVEAAIWPGQTVNNPVLERVYVAPERNSQAADWREVFQ